VWSRCGRKAVPGPQTRSATRVAHCGRNLPGPLATRKPAWLRGRLRRQGRGIACWCDTGVTPELSPAGATGDLRRLPRPPDRIRELDDLLEREPLQPPSPVGLGRARMRRTSARRADGSASRSPVLKLTANAQCVEVAALSAANLDPSLGERYRGRCPRSLAIKAPNGFVPGMAPLTPLEMIGVPRRRRQSWPSAPRVSRDEAFESSTSSGRPPDSRMIRVSRRASSSCSWRT